MWFGARPQPQNGGFGGLAGWKYEPPGRSLPLPGLSVFCEHRFVVVVGEWIVEPGFFVALYEAAMEEKLRAQGIPTEVITLMDAPHPYGMSQP